MISSDQTTKKVAGLDSGDESLNYLNRLIDNNSEQFGVHKNLTEYALMFDPFYFECLTQLAAQDEAKTSSQPVEDVYKLCMWNSRADRHYLTTLTRTNQLIIFDCTRLGVENRENVLNKQLGEVGFLKTFDVVTNSKCLNLTELWTCQFKSSIIDRQWKSIDDYLSGLDQIVPVSMTWSSSPVVLDGLVTRIVEILFVAFKSNQIACFLIGDGLEVNNFNKSKIFFLI